MKYNTQEIVESLWIFRAALGQIVPDGLVVNAQGAKFRIQSRDLMNLKIALVGAHEFDVTGFIRRNVSADTKGAFIDVGANIGYYSVIVGCITRAPVVAIEPSPTNLHQLQANVLLNNLSHVRIIEKAAWHESRKCVDLHVRDPYNLGANTVLDTGPIESSVETTTVDEVVASLGITSIGVVKIDVEGVELEVLLGMRESFRGMRPRYIVCALDHPDESRRRHTWERIVAEGYQEVDFKSERAVIGNDYSRANVLFRECRRGFESRNQ